MDPLESAISRLNNLGVDTSNLYQDYYKIPLENTDLSKVEAEHPTKAKIVSKHTVVIDSRQRDYTIYPDANSYLINLMEPHRNVEKIELIAAMLPKTEYNVNSENNLILLNINGNTKGIYLTPGEYTIGSNKIGNGYVANGDLAVYGILAEVSRALNTHPDSSGAFNTFLATIPEEFGGTGNYAAVLNRIIITNSAVNFRIDFTNVNYSSGSPFRILGFNKQIYTSAANSVVIYG